jgi:CRP-like cAMP-binding protein
VNPQLAIKDPCVEHFGPGTPLDLPVHVAHEMFRRSRRMRFTTGDVLFRAQDIGDTLYLVCDGRIGMRCLSPSGHSVMSSSISQGGVVGLHALFEPSARHPTTAIAMVATTARAIVRDDIMSLAAISPMVMLSFARSMASEAISTVARMPVLAWDKAESRVVGALVELALRHGRTVTGGGVTVAVTHDEIAEHAGVARPTATTILQAASRAGLVLTGRRRIDVPDVKALLAWAQS